jgi:transcriptional regulator with XRE-family HTH domain
MIGDIIKKRRIRLGISQQELAELLGYQDRSAVSRLESGERQVAVDQLLELAKILKCSVYELLEEKEIRPINDRITELLSQLSDSKKEEALHYIQFLLEIN